MTRYWMSIGDGNTYGPYTVEELRALMLDGRATRTSQLCEEGSQQWFPAGNVLPELGSPPTSPTAVPPLPVLPVGKSISLVWSIVATVLSLLLCCLPIGVVPLVLAINANSRYAVGDLTGGDAGERNYRTWMIVTWVLLGVGLMLMVVQLVLGVGMLMAL